MVAYGYEGGTEFKQIWKSGAYGGEAHQFRVEDVDYDGKDEVLHMGYALNSDGSLRYSIPDVVHGDRYHIAPFSNAQNNKEMWGYGVQQRNPSTLLEYIYNVSTGELLWKNMGGDGSLDIGRGDIGDVDPTHEGYECWSFQGMYNMKGEKISDTNAYPSLKLYWDGDLLSESYNDSKIEKWNYATKGVGRLATTWKIVGCNTSDRGAPMFYGDILGDWREEVICTGTDNASLVIISTTIPTEYRINCLAQDPAYRNDMTSKGYVQSNMLSYYMGADMDVPPVPNIRYIVGNWTPEQREQLITKGKVYDADGKAFIGQHMKSVSGFPDNQGDVDNIQLLSQEEHLEAHKGDWHNVTNWYYDPDTKTFYDFDVYDYIKFPPDDYINFHPEEARILIGSSAEEPQKKQAEEKKTPEKKKEELPKPP